MVAYNTKKFCAKCNQVLKSRTRTWCDKCLITKMQDEKNKEGEETPEQEEEIEEPAPESEANTFD